MSVCIPTVFWHYAYNQSTDVSLHSPFYRPLIRCVCPQKPTLSPIYTALFQVVKSLSLYSQTFQTSSEIFTHVPVCSPLASTYYPLVYPHSPFFCLNTPCVCPHIHRSSPKTLFICSPLTLECDLFICPQVSCVLPLPVS